MTRTNTFAQTEVSRQITETIGAYLLRVLNQLADLDGAYRERQKLKSMPGHRLADMGMTRADANRSFYGQRGLQADNAPAPITTGLARG